LDPIVFFTPPHSRCTGGDTEIECAAQLVGWPSYPRSGIRSFSKARSTSSTAHTRFLAVLSRVLNGRSGLPRDYRRELIQGSANNIYEPPAVK
jgi:hypothetical protein